MRICLIIDDYVPDSIKVGAKMMHELACEFHKQGHEVIVIAPSTEIIESKQIEIIDEIKVLRFKSGKIKNVGKVRRAINESLLSYRAWKSFYTFYYKNPHDLIIYYSPSIFWGTLVSKLKKLWNAKSYLVLRDIFPQWAVDNGLISRGSLIEKYFRFFEAKNYQAADTIGLMSQKNLELFQSSSISNQQLEILQNWASDTPIKPSSFYRKKLHLENKIVYFYGGNMGYAQDMMNILRLVIRMQKNTKIHFVLVGLGDEVELIKNVIERQELKNITLLPPVSQDTYKQMLSEFDVGLFSLHKNHTTHNFPGKLLGYMVQSKPILGSINNGNDLKNVIEEANAGYISINGDDDKFYENAVALFNEQHREKLGYNSKKLLMKSFSVEYAVQRILFRIKS